ncbi:MAG: glycine cleavage system protein H [Deltaproteobacteria bacterium]|nr:glycine cleavage system protein H [Deltaproteobacteria bacterium]
MDLRLLKYTSDHLWVTIDDDNIATIGLTEEGLEDYLELLSIKLPSEGSEFQKDQSFGRVTVGKGLGFKLFAPFAGEVVNVNDDIIDAPDVLLEDPYEEGWLVRMSINSMSEYDDLMTRDEYEQYLADSDPDTAGEDDEDEEEEDESDYLYYDEDEDEDEDEEDDEDDDYYDEDDDDDY